MISLNKTKNILTGTGVWFLFLFCVSISFAQQSENDYVENIDKTGNVDSVASLKNEMNELEPSKKLNTTKNKNLKEVKGISPLSLLTGENAEKELKTALGPLANIPEKKLKKMVLAQKDKNKIINFLSKHPKFLTFVIRFMKDEKAPYSLAKISQNRKLVYIYLGFLFISILVNIKVKKIIMKKNKSSIKIFFLEVLRFFLFTLLRMAVFIIIFYKFLEPTIQIIYKL